ncbi:hypothetical protein [Caballeronia sp. TF1N1]|uniref:hypothetical protein n=1 Tax=Caballeronia sp. TF1N1 TaxID=2878153 RepID=UPI001FD0E307|nr:hypothetical protein [Caballeronia sp. TF1N1]
MISPMNVVELEMLLQAYYLGDGPDAEQNPATREAAHRLTKLDLCRYVQDGGDGTRLRIEPKGKFYVEHLLTIPYPEEVMSFQIPTAD